MFLLKINYYKQYRALSYYELLNKFKSLFLVMELALQGENLLFDLETRDY